MPTVPSLSLLQPHKAAPTLRLVPASATSQSLFLYLEGSFPPSRSHSDHTFSTPAFVLFIPGTQRLTSSRLLPLVCELREAQGSCLALMLDIQPQRIGLRGRGISLLQKLCRWGGAVTPLFHCSPICFTPSRGAEPIWEQRALPPMPCIWHPHQDTLTLPGKLATPVP